MAENTSGNVSLNYEIESEDVLFHDTAIRVLVILFYTLVFCLSFFGNLLVLIVSIINIKKTKSLSNFFLINLTVADLGIGIFCVYPNMFSFIYVQWKLGSVACKLYYYTQAVCYSSSLLTLLAMSIERYMVILRPLSSRPFMQRSLLLFLVITIWILSFILNIPHLLIYDVVIFPVSPGASILHCVLTVNVSDVEVYVTASFVVWFLIPVLVLLFCHIRIIMRLVVGIKTLGDLPVSESTASYLSDTRTMLSDDQRPPEVFNGRSSLRRSKRHCRILRSRQRAIRLLVAMVFIFIVTVLPYQVRVMWQTWSDSDMEDTFVKLFTISTFILYYGNSAIHPILYAFLSDNFRKVVRDTVCSKLQRQQRGNSLTLQVVQLSTENATPIVDSV